MRRNTQRLYESIMTVVDRSVRKALNETYLPTYAEQNTANIQNTYQKILNKQKVSNNEIKQANNEIAVIKPKDVKELRKIIEFYSIYYPEDSLNWLDVSDIINMTRLFANTEYNGDISKWDVSNVKYMNSMF